MDRNRRQWEPGRGPRRTVLRFGAFELHPTRQLLRDGAPIQIGRIALDLLGALLRSAGNLVTKDELFEAGWSGLVVVENALHQHMRALRTALGGSGGLIVTVPRRGYRFVGAVEEISVDVETADVLGQRPPVPSPLTSLIGRENEMQATDELLAEHRCVTLLGPGGVGKTRLALEVARRWVDRGDGPVLWVELAAITMPDDVEGAIAAACGLPGPAGVPPMTRVQFALRDGAALLVLDNCEHLVETCAGAAHALLQAGPRLRVLATSQRPLGISGEHRLRVPMLALPAVGTTDTDVVAASPAVRLLLERIGECDSQLHFDADALTDAAALCRQLDGNALAIELAAARVASLGLAATRAALTDHFRLLADGLSKVLPKHRSLEAMIGWSHALLPDGQARLFRQLAVFTGGWTIESALAVVGAATDAPFDITTGLAQLAERSLIVSEGASQSPRFRMLEAQRVFAVEQLGAHGEQPRCAAAHAQHFATVFDAGYGEWDDTPDARWMARYGPERENLRSAIRFALTAHDSALAARLVGSSIWLWRAAGVVHELGQALQHLSLLPLEPPEPPESPSREVEARLRLARAYALHATSSESTSVRSAAAAAVKSFEGSKDTLGAANALLCLASAHAQLGDTASQWACLERIDALLREHRHGKTFAWYCGSHAWAAQWAGDLQAASNWATQSRAAYRGSGAWHGETRAMLHLADLCLAAGSVAQAIEVGEECVARLQGGPHRDDLGRALANLGAARFACGDLARARACWAGALEELRGLNFSYWVFDHIALLAIAEGRDTDAARMIGYADAGYERLRKGGRVQNEQRAHDRAMAHLRSQLSAEDLAAWLSAGANASEHVMVADALGPVLPPVRLNSLRSKIF